jgi:hypothetical protein
VPLSNRAHHEKRGSILMRGPMFYEFRIEGELIDCWKDWFEGLRLESLDEGEIRLSGLLPDQAALHGVLLKLRDLNLTLLSVNLVPDSQRERNE